LPLHAPQLAGGGPWKSLFKKTSSTLSNRDELIEFPRKFTQRSRKSSLSIFQRMGIADSENLSSDKI